MQYGNSACLCSKEPGIVAKVSQGRPCNLKKQAVTGLLVNVEQFVQTLRNGKNQVEVLPGQQLTFQFIGP